MADNQIVIDRGQMYRDLRDIGDYLAELRYIETAMQHIRDRNQQFAQSGEPVGASSFQVQLGTQYPFTSPQIMTPATANIAAEMQVFETLAAAADQWASNEMTYLNHLVQQVMCYPIHGYGLIDGHLEAVWTVLETRVEADFGYLGGELDAWSGTAASDFKSLFYHKFEISRRNQQFLVRSLQGGLAASRRIVEYSQQSLVNAVAGAKAVLLEQLYLRSMNGGGIVSRPVVLVVAGALTVLGAVTGGVSLWLAAGLTAGGFGASVAASEIPAAHVSQDHSIEGGSAEDVCLSLADALGDVSAFLGSELDYLHDELRRVRMKIQQLHDDYLICPKRPMLADGVDGEDFYHTSSEQYP
jgi:hypothetical protein